MRALHDRCKIDKSMTKVMYQEQVRALERAIRAAEAENLAAALLR